ncbi:MAG: hypothetical protein Q7T41_04375 [Candidatus Saccharibacteria bacterium]|nr:hypothetical protein [Candidatus Saccharibacteria bacterium]
MKKLCVFLYSISLFGVSLYGLSSHSYYVQIMMNLDRPHMFFRTILVIVLMTYAFVPWLRTFVTRSLVGIGGLALLTIGIFSVFSPSLGGYYSSWMVLGDSITLIEGGILAIVISGELSARRTDVFARIYIVTRVAMLSGPRKIAYASNIHAVKMR